MAVPAVTIVTPGSGTAGTVVEIDGSGFTGVTSVTFDGVAAASFTFVDDATVMATAPAGPSGVIEVVVTNPDGSSPPSAGSSWSYEFTPPIPGAADCLALSVPGFTADTITADPNGICYTTQALDGCFDSPPVRSGTLEAGQISGLPQGETVVVGRVNARTVDVQIVAHTLDRQSPLGNVLCFTAIDAVKDAFRAIYVPVLMDVIDPSGQERTMLARRVGPIRTQIIGTAAAVRFNIPMLGEDPRLVTV